MKRTTPPRAADVLGRWLAATFARGHLLGFALLVAALVAGTLGAATIAYACLAALVAVIAWGFAGSGVWLWLLAMAVLKAEWGEGRHVSACLRFTLWLLAGTLLVFMGGGAIWGFLSRWPFGYWPGATVPPP